MQINCTLAQHNKAAYQTTYLPTGAAQESASGIKT